MKRALWYCGVVARLTFSFVVAPPAALTARGELIVAPNSLESTDGNFFHDGGAVPVRVMQIYDASEFAALDEPILITQISYRPDTIAALSGPRSLVAQVFASTTDQTVAGLSRVFAENIGADNTLVFDGTLIWDTANLPGPGNTRQFDIDVPLTTPFHYDPRAGNLMLDFQISSAGGTLIRRDAVMAHPAVNFVASFGSATAPIGNVLGFGFITQFTFMTEIVGDYNGNGRVEQADLDLVLLNWGNDGATPPAGWVIDLPAGIVDQGELDRVLLNWGNQLVALGAQSVPEPSSLLLVGLVLVAIVTARVAAHRPPETV